MMLWRGLCKGGIQLCTSGARRFAGTYSRSDLKDYYQVLGVERKASSEEIKNAFFTQSKKCHPDRDPSNPLLHAQFVRLNEAYKVLSKHSSRREYDQILEAIQRERWVPSDRSPNKTYSTSHNWKQSYNRDQGPFYRSASEKSEWYWSQFPPKREWQESAHERELRNRSMFWYCIFMAATSIFVHYQIFSTVRNNRRTELEEEQLKIMNFYNEKRENAKVNGFHKQQEILVQKHEERLRKLYGFDLEEKARK